MLTYGSGHQATMCKMETKKITTSRWPTLICQCWLQSSSDSTRWPLLSIIVIPESEKMRSSAQTFNPAPHRQTFSLYITNPNSSLRHVRPLTPCSLPSSIPTNLKLGGTRSCLFDRLCGDSTVLQCHPRRP